MAYTAIDDGSEYFHTQLYTGTGSSGLEVRNNANSGDFTPDWLWVKPRSASDNHVLFDSSRGFDKQLKANGNDAEDTHSPAKFTRETNGFDIDSTDGNYNGNGTTYVAWQWKCNNATTASNSDGGITSTVQANTTAGFSIILYTGTGSTSSVGHGLGDTPDWIIYKRRSGGTRDWMVFHQIASAGGKGLILNSASAGDTASSIFGGNLPTSTTIPVGFATETNTSGESHIAYAFAEKQGFSKFSSFVGNGSTDGPFVYTGFKPAWLMYKEDENQGGWGIWDSKRVIENPIDIRLLANNNSADDTSNDNRQDFLSNGFKVRTSSGGFNQSGRTIYYMAFAEHPFVSSKGVPVTAR